MAQNTLLLCYDFPPNQGIGGRRWAKIAKALSRNGTEIFVVKADPIRGNIDSPWSADIKNEKIHVTSIPREYPSALSHPSGGIADRIRFHFYKRAFRKKYDGTIYDLALCWEENFLNTCRRIIRENDIKNILATGAPFNLVHQTAKLANEFPDLTVLIDYRDPWLTAVNYGIPQLPYHHFIHEKRKQNEVFENVSYITCPNKYMLEEIQSSGDYLAGKAKFEVLTHFYDEDEINKYLSKVSQDDKIRLVYGGTIYMGMEDHFSNLAKGLELLKGKSPELYNRLCIEIYTKDQRFESYFSKHTSVVTFAKPIGSELFNRIAQAKGSLIFLAEHNKNYRTTKFFETLPFGKPLVFMGTEGYVSKFIEEQNLGYVLRNPETELPALVQKLSVDHFKSNSDFDYRQFSLRSLANQIEDLLQ